MWVLHRCTATLNPWDLYISLRTFLCRLSGKSAAQVAMPSKGDGRYWIETISHTNNETLEASWHQHSRYIPRPCPSAFSSLNPPLQDCSCLTFGPRRNVRLKTGRPDGSHLWVRSIPFQLEKAKHIIQVCANPEVGNTISEVVRHRLDKNIQPYLLGDGKRTQRTLLNHLGVKGKTTST